MLSFTRIKGSFIIGNFFSFVNRIPQKYEKNIEKIYQFLRPRYKVAPSSLSRFL